MVNAIVLAVSAMVAARIPEDTGSVETRSQVPESCQDILLPLSRSPTMRETVAYAVETILNQCTADNPGVLRLVVVEPLIADAASEQQRERLQRAATWAAEAAGEQRDRLTVDTEVLGLDRYVFSPADVAAVLNDAASLEQDMHLILDPQYDPGVDTPLLWPMERELDRYRSLTWEVAPVRRTVTSTVIGGATGPGAVVATASIAFVFYQLLAWELSLFNIVTGALTAGVTALLFSALLFVHPPSIGSAGTVVRFFQYIPVLLWEIVVANIQLAVLLLDPRASIDPEMFTISPELDNSMAVTVLANSITLTPGTLTVRADGKDMLIHAINKDFADGLRDGGLQRWTQYIFSANHTDRILADRQEGRR